MDHAVSNLRFPARRPGFAAAAANSVPSLNTFHQASSLESLGFGVLLLFTYFSYSRALEFILSGGRPQLVFALICMVAAIASSRIGIVIGTPIAKWLIAFSVWMVFTIPFALWPGGSFSVVTETWSKAFMMFLTMAALISNTSQISKVISAIALAFLTLSFMAFGLGELVEGRLQMPWGTYGNPNDLANAMVSGIAYWVSIVSNKKANPILRVIGILAFAPMMMVMLKTGSRGALIALVVTGLVMLAHFSMMTRIKILAGGAVLAAMLLPFVSNDLRGRFLLFFGDEDAPSTMTSRMAETTKGSSEGRLHLLEESLRVTAAHPLLGVGPDGFILAENENATAAGSRGGWHGTHNAYTQVSSEMGIPGLICFLGILVACWRGISWSKRTAFQYNHPHKDQIEAFSAALRWQMVFILVAGCFSHSAYSSTIPGVAAMVCGLMLAVRREVASLQPAAGSPQGSLWSRPLVVGPAKFGNRLMTPGRS